MQQIDHWPYVAELALPNPVSQDLYRQLLEPFDSEEKAQEFFEEAIQGVIHKYDGPVWVEKMPCKAIYLRVRFVVRLCEKSENIGLVVS